MNEFTTQPYDNCSKRIIVDGPDDLTFYVDNDDVDSRLVAKQLPYILETLNAYCLPELKAISERHYIEEGKNNEIRELLEEALETDGEHHKQWYLWRIAEITGVAEDIYRGNYEPGIAP